MLEVEKYIIYLQDNKCANNPYKSALNLSDYYCPQWRHNNGYFDDAMYVINYINEYSLVNNCLIQNLQALCPNCNAVKVNRFNKQKKHFTTSQLAIGVQYMDTNND